MSYTIEFNKKNVYGSSKEKNDVMEEAEGPIVERKCPQCQNDKMSYATLQLRSADEGQTVFYTCTKCKYVFLSVIKKHAFFFYEKGTVLRRLYFQIQRDREFITENFIIHFNFYIQHHLIS